MHVSESLSRLIDRSAIAGAVGSRQGELFSHIESTVSSAVQSMSPRSALSFRLLLGEREVAVVQAAPTPGYVSVLIAYMRGKNHEGYTIDSCVTPVVMQAAEKAVVDFYTDSKTTQQIADGISNQLQSRLDVNKLIRGEAKSQKDWLRRELDALKNFDSASSVAAHTIDAVVNQLHEFFTSSLGNQFLSIVGKAMATGAGGAAKGILAKYIAIAIQKAVAMGAVKSLVITVVKKIGVTMLIKTAVGKMVAATLAVILGVGSIPVLYIVLPIVAAFLVYDYNHFPEKLSKKLPTEVTSSLRGNFNRMNENIIDGIVTAVMSHLIDEVTKIKVA